MMNRLLVRLIASHAIVALLGAAATYLIVRQLAPSLFDQSMMHAGNGSMMGQGQLQGPSLRDLVAARDAALAERTTQQIAASVAAAEAIQAPFDREILGGKDAPGRQRVRKTIDSLTQQSKDLVAAAQAIGITRLTLVQP